MKMAYPSDTAAAMRAAAKAWSIGAVAKADHRTFAAEGEALPGPVVLDVPKDIQNWKGTFRGEGLLELRGYRERMRELYGSRMPEDRARTFFDILRKSDRPLLYAGGGVIKGEASRELRRWSRPASWSPAAVCRSTCAGSPRSTRRSTP